MLNTQKADTFALGKLLDTIRDGAFVVPDFQREFAWGAKDVRDLVQSIFLDYYIGNLLLWDASHANVDALACEGLSGFGESLDAKYIVLDGQQRLTALHYAFFQPDVPFPGRKNPYLFFLRVDKFGLDRDDPEAFFYYRKTAYYERLLAEREEQYAQHVMPLTVFTDKTFDTRDWLAGYSRYWGQRTAERQAPVVDYVAMADEHKQYFRDLERDYKVSYIKLTDEVELAKVCEIFTKINAKGVRLDTFDLLNAITKPKGLQLKYMHRAAREKLPDVFGDLNTKSYLLMVMSIIEQDYCSPKYLYYLVPGAVKRVGRGAERSEKTLVKDAAAFERLWEEAVATLSDGIQKVSNARSYGAIRERFLPYPSILPAFSAIQRLVRRREGIVDPASAPDKVARWYWSAVFDERYSSSAETTSASDYQRIGAWLRGGEEPSEILMPAEEVDRMDLTRVQSSQAARFRAVFDLIIRAGARDWATYGLPEDHDLDDHHVVPKTHAKELGVEDLIDSVLNRVPISQPTNRNVIRARLPNAYIRDMLANSEEEKVYETFESHLISRRAVEILLRKPFTGEDFREFLEERGRMVRGEVKGVLGVG